VEGTGKSIAQWSCFYESHPSSKEDHELRWHYHVLIETRVPCRWAEVANRLRAGGVYASAATSSSRNSYWSGFAYCFTPSGRKPVSDLDKDYLLSPGHEEVPVRLLKRRSGDQRLQPLAIYHTVVEQRIASLPEFMSFAETQRLAGDPRWAEMCIRMTQAKVREMIASANLMKGASALLARGRLNHLDILQEALGRECMCTGLSIGGWEQILQLNGYSPAEYCQSMLELFQHGGGKNLNHYYVGEPNSGKTALTRPLLALFGDRAFVKPQVPLLEKGGFLVLALGFQFWVCGNVESIWLLQTHAILMATPATCK